MEGLPLPLPLPIVVAVCAWTVFLMQSALAVLLLLSGGKTASKVPRVSEDLDDHLKLGPLTQERDRHGNAKDTRGCCLRCLDWC